MLNRTPPGMRLAPMLIHRAPLPRRDGGIVLSDAEAALLVSMIAETIAWFTLGLMKACVLKGEQWRCLQCMSCIERTASAVAPSHRGS